MNLDTIKEDAYQADNNKNYELSILVGMDSLVYAIAEIGGKILLLKKIVLDSAPKKSPVQSQIQALFQNEPQLSGAFAKVKIGVFSDYFTFLPQRLYNEASKEQYLQKIAELAGPQTILDNTSASTAITTIFAIDTPLYELLTTTFPDCEIFNCQAVIVEALLHHEDAEGNKKIYCYFQSRKLTVFVLENRNLLLCNSFAFQNAQDCLYFLLLIFDQFRLSQDETPVLLTGDITEDSEIYRLLFKYLKKLNFLDGFFEEQLGTKLKNLSTHFHFGIFSLVNHKAH